MKKIITIFILSMFYYFSFSQPKAGDFTIGGSSEFGFSFVNETKEIGDVEVSEFKQSNLSLMPTWRYLITDHIGAGLLTFVEVSTISGSSDVLLAVGPTIRAYLGKTNIRPYLDGTVLYGKIFYPANGSNSIFGYNTGIGLACFIRENISIDIGAAYAYMSQKGDSDPFGGDVTNKQKGLNLSVGITVVL